MSTVDENSKYKQGGEGRTSTTDAREGEKQAGSDRLEKPGPENGPKEGQGEGQPEGTQKGCASAQGTRLRDFALLDYALNILVEAERWQRTTDNSTDPVHQAAVESLDAALDGLRELLGLSERDVLMVPVGRQLGEAIGRAELARELKRKLAERTAERDLERRRVERGHGRESELRKHLDRAQREAGELAARVDDLMVDRERLAEESDTAQAAADIFEQGVRNDEEDSAELAGRIDALTSERDKLRAELEERRIHGAPSRAKLEAERDELAGRVDALTSERDVLSKKLEELRATAGLYESTGHDAEQLIAELRERVGSLETRLASAHRTLRRESARNVELVRERDQLRNAYLTNLTERGQFASQLREMLEQYEARANSLERVRDDYESLQNRYADLERACAALREELDEANRTAKHTRVVEDDLHAKIGDLCPGCVTELIEVGREALQAYEQFHDCSDHSHDEWWRRSAALMARCAVADGNGAHSSANHARGAS